MKSSSSFELALIGGPFSFAFSLPPIASVVPTANVPRVSIASCDSVSCLMVRLENREKGRRGSMGEIWETYDVGADLTTENRVLGDHDDEFKGMVRTFFVQLRLVTRL